MVFLYVLNCSAPLPRGSEDQGSPKQCQDTALRLLLSGQIASEDNKLLLHGMSW